VKMRGELLADLVRELADDGPDSCRASPA
jgi:hypothetical protein